MNEAPRRRSLRGLLLLVAASSIVLAGFGSWQVQRLSWKEALIAEREALLAAPPVAVVSISGNLPAWRRVRLTGTFLNDKSLLVGPRSYRGLPHWRLITPLKLPGDGIVLIDRGWIPDQGKKAAFRVVSRPSGAVSLEGILRQPTASGYFAPPNVPETDTWFRVAPGEMGTRLALSDVAPYWVAVQSKRAGDGYPIPDAVVSTPSNNHLQYAVTWYGLSLAALVVAGFYWRRERRPTS